MKSRLFVTTAVFLLAVSANLTGEDKAAEQKSAKEDPLKGVKCIVSGKAINPEATVRFKEKGKLYFCCEGCPAAFEQAKEKFVAKANHQLLATQQVEQVKCPLSGGKLNPEAKVKVAGAVVKFCCEKCQGKVATTEGDAQIELAFNEKAFEKAFQFKKADKESQAAAAAQSPDDAS
jgi:YHS domain-containing protein